MVEKDSEAQMSEAHEATDDASSSPASNERQHTTGPPTEKSRTNETGVALPASNYERGAAEGTRTNVAGVGPAEADDLSNAPPGHIDLEADLDSDRTFYPTAAAAAGKHSSGGDAAAGTPVGGTDMNLGDQIEDGKKEEDREKLFPDQPKRATNQVDRSTQNLSP